MEILSRLVSKQVILLILVVSCRLNSILLGRDVQTFVIPLKCAYIVNNNNISIATDMEVSKIMGRILEVRSPDKTSIFPCVASGESCSMIGSCVPFLYIKTSKMILFFLFLYFLTIIITYMFLYFC